MTVSLPGALEAALLALAALLVVLGVLVVTRRAWRLRRERSRAALAEPLRPVLLRLAAGEAEEVEEASEALWRLDERAWAATETTVETLLLKVRGETHAAVVALLERRGTLATATRRCTLPSGVARAHGAEVLGAAGRSAAVPDLLRLLDDAEPEVRQVAARALGRVGDGAAAGPLVDSLVGARAVPPRIVASALLRIGPAGHPAVERALGAGDPLQRAVSAEIAGLSGALRLAPALVALLDRDPEVQVRLRAAQALGRLGSPVGVAALVAATGGDHPAELRAAAVRGLGDLGDTSTVARLVELVTDPTHDVAAGAATALTQCGPEGLAALAAVGTAPHAADALAAAALRGLLPPPPAPATALEGSAGPTVVGGSASPAPVDGPLPWAVAG